MRIAVVGAGVAGLSAAWLLSQTHDVVVFEREARLGGHANTVDVPDGTSTCPIDTGFIVYNTANYPNLIALFDHLGVETAPTRMSFAVSLEAGAYEYSGSGLGGLFGQPGNALNMGHWRLVADLRRFFAQAQEIAEAGSLAGNVSLGDWLKSEGYSNYFVERHILPMGAAIWSTSADDMLGFPALSFHRFFSHHGLLTVRNRPAWRTVRNGSRNYVARLRETMTANCLTSSPVVSVTRDASGVTLRTQDGASARFDAVVMAAHADETLGMLGDADEMEATTLGAFRYTQNEAVLHTDSAWMPKRKRLWSAWNYLSAEKAGDLSVTYWMNELQPLQTSRNWFVTLNPSREIATDYIHSTYSYAHPLYDHAAIAAQSQLWNLQGRRRTFFCGSYFGYGFHEDAIQSGLAAAEALAGVARPWSRPGQNDRLVLPQAAVSHRGTVQRVAWDDAAGRASDAVDAA